MTGKIVLSLVCIVLFCSCSRIFGQGGNNHWNPSDPSGGFQPYPYNGQGQQDSQYGGQYYQAMGNMRFNSPPPSPWDAPPGPPPPPFGGPPPQLTKAVAILTGTAGVRGMVVFTQIPQGGLNITGNITGLAPSSQHGFHIHQYGDLSNGCTSAGSHFNPTNSTHGSPDSQMHHAGDLGNIAADGSGTVILNIIDNSISLGGMNNVVGRGVVVHQLPDDLGLGGNADSLATGNAGGRLACGAIGIAM